MSKHEEGDNSSLTNDQNPNRTSSTGDKVLLGAEGQEYILTKLSSGDPKSAITSFQKQYSSFNSNVVYDCIPPVLELTDLLNVQRNNLFFGLMNHLKKILLEKVENENEEIENMDKLLEQVFPYIGFDELRPIAYALLKRMPQIPNKFLIQLTNPEIFKNLPIEVKRQVWVNDENLFIKHISSLLKKYDTPQLYKYDYLNVIKIDPKKKREKNQTLSNMINILGKNVLLYHRVLNYCRNQFIQSGARHFCTFRYDLLMSLHDNQIQQLHQMDYCHYFCWWLDAWIRTVHANLLNYVNTMQTDDICKNLTCAKLSSSNLTGSSNSPTGPPLSNTPTGSTNTSSSSKKKPTGKKGTTGGGKSKKKRDSISGGDSSIGGNTQSQEASSQSSSGVVHNTTPIEPTIRTDQKQQIVLPIIEFSDNVQLKDFFDVRRMKELRHYFDNQNQQTESEVWGDIAIICRSPYLSNIFIQQIFYLLELIYSQHTNAILLPIEKVLVAVPIKQKNKRKALSEPESTAVGVLSSANVTSNLNSSATGGSGNNGGGLGKKKLKLKTTTKQQETTATVNTTNTKGTTIKISFKTSAPTSPSISSGTEMKSSTSNSTGSSILLDSPVSSAPAIQPVPTASPTLTSSASNSTISSSTSNQSSLPPYLTFIEDAYYVHDFADYIETLTRLYISGEKAQSMLKKKINLQLAPVDEYLIQEFYPFIQQLIFSLPPTNENEFIDTNQLQEQLKKQTLTRKLILFSILRFHQNSRIASENSLRIVSSGTDDEDEYDTINKPIPGNTNETKKTSVDDIEKFRNIYVPKDAKLYAENLIKFRYLFNCLFVENNELNQFGKTIILKEFNFIHSLISDCNRLIKHIQHSAIPVLLSGNIKWFFTEQLSELVKTYEIIFDKFAVPYIISTKQESLTFQVNVSACLKDIASATHLLGCILLTIPKEVFSLREKRDDDNDDESEEELKKRIIHNFDEYKEHVTKMKNFCQTMLQQLKSATLSDTQLTKLFQATETQLMKEWKALQTEAKSLLSLQEEEIVKKEVNSPTPFTPGKFGLYGFKPTFFNPTAFQSSLSPSQLPKFPSPTPNAFKMSPVTTSVEKTEEQVVKVEQQSREIITETAIKTETTQQQQTMDESV
ncbi:hypothetical protein ABK040_004890 [Willaertia magna]